MQRTPKKLPKQLKTHLSLFLCLYCFSLLISIHLSFNYAVRQFASRLLLNSFWLCCRKPTAHWMYQVKADKKDVFGDDAIECQQLPFPISIYHQTWTFSLVRRSPLGSKLRLCLFHTKVPRINSPKYDCQIQLPPNMRLSFFMIQNNFSTLSPLLCSEKWFQCYKTTDNC